MKKISLDIETGNFLLDENIIAPLNEEDFIATANSNNIIFEISQTNTNIKNLSTDGIFKNLNFGINFYFENSLMKSIWLPWDGGNTKKYEYNTTEAQLLSDKKTLTKLLSEITNKQPDKITKATSTFYFPWGLISASASIQSMNASIGISWN